MQTRSEGLWRPCPGAGKADLNHALDGLSIQGAKGRKTGQLPGRLQPGALSLQLVDLYLHMQNRSKGAMEAMPWGRQGGARACTWRPEHSEYLGHRNSAASREAAAAWRTLSAAGGPVPTHTDGSEGLRWSCWGQARRTRSMHWQLLGAGHSERRLVLGVIWGMTKLRKPSMHWQPWSRRFHALGATGAGSGALW